MYSRDYTRKRTGGAVSIMNQYDMCQLVQKWFLVCWVQLDHSIAVWNVLLEFDMVPKSGPHKKCLVPDNAPPGEPETCAQVN